MGLFSGEYDIKLDGKGRLVLPSKVKYHISTQSVVAVRGFEPCIDFYNAEEWEKIISKIMALNSFVEENRILQRSIISRSVELDIDSAGRVVIPQKLLDYAQIQSEVTLLGVGNKFEIWDRKSLEKYQLGNNNELSALAEKLLV